MLVALALMPLGMAGAPAAAGPLAGAGSGHCDEHQKPADAPADVDMHCATCAALPVLETAAGGSELRPELPRLVHAARAMTDAEPELATPPPRPA